MDIPERLLRALSATTHQAYLMSLGGNPSGRQRAAYERMTNPRTGDIVVEVSTIYHRTQPESHCVGFLHHTAHEPYHSDPALWDEMLPETLETATYVQGFDGSLHRWTNADFIAAYAEALD